MSLLRPLLRCVLAAPLLLLAASAHASFLSGEALDTMADWIAIVVLIVVPIGAIVVFWMIHVLPEKIAEKRHHPQTDAINTLCLLSLVFGGLLWPIAWIWAFTRPVAYRAAYGTDKHADYFVEMGERARAGDLTAAELADFRHELDALAGKERLGPDLAALRRELDIVPVRTETPVAAAGAAAPKGA